SHGSAAPRREARRPGQGVSTALTANGWPCMQWLITPCTTCPVTRTCVPGRSRADSAPCSSYVPVRVPRMRQAGSAPCMTVPLTVIVRPPKPPDGTERGEVATPDGEGDGAPDEAPDEVVGLPPGSPIPVTVPPQAARAGAAARRHAPSRQRASRDRRESDGVISVRRGCSPAGSLRSWHAR